MSLEATTGRIWISVDIALSSDSGRAKHVDITEQGAWVYESVAAHLRQNADGYGAAILGARYHGEHAKDAPIKTDTFGADEP